MTKNQYIETGKGFIALANLIGGMSVINNLFGNKGLSIPEIAIIFYTFVALYIAGNMLIKKGDEIWAFIYFGLYLPLGLWYLLIG